MGNKKARFIQLELFPDLIGGNMNKCENCKSCLFYREDEEDIGTCSITDNIVDADQEACNDYRNTDTGKNE